ncbi:hypothetical protein [Falsiroseomonas oryzae]|uniref:hypothetical protein n=1 Tax=Falsiroseomonas oryzae TaxID=2766473 RepID=UPI0022EA883D|nr:hypothetical protein [Roseomonas sp. MO-31]
MHLAIRSPATAPWRIFPGRAAGVGLALLLGACSSAQFPTDSMTAPFAAPRHSVMTDSLTAQRVRGSSPEVSPLLPEPGNVWPEQELESRPTLLSGPEEAMRNVPEYRPSMIDGAPPARSPVPTPAPGARTGSAGSLQTLPPPDQLPRAPAQPPIASPAPPPPGGPGQVTIDPAGRPAVTTGQAGSVRGVTQPGVGSGSVVTQGNVETWIGPDGRVQTRVVPPRQ